MRWLKHLTAAHQDGEVDRVLEECGAVAYGVYWLILEDIAGPMESGAMVPEATHSDQRWCQICHVDPRVWRNCKQTLGKKLLVFTIVEGNRVSISAPKILKYKDEYSKKSGQSTSLNRADREQIQSRGKTETEADAPPGAENPECVSPVPINQPRWKTDPDYRSFRDASASFWPDLIDNDFEQGYGFWRVMDWEERKRVIDGIEARKAAGIDSNFVCKPEKFLRTKEFNRRIKPRDSPVSAQRSTRNEALIAAQRIKDQQEKYSR